MVHITGSVTSLQILLGLIRESIRVSSLHCTALPVTYTTFRSNRFVWLTPESMPSGGCLHAFSEIGSLGRSEPISVRHAPKRKRQTLTELGDPYGAWFDGVAYLQSKEPSESFLAKDKEQRVGIVGAGMAGLMSALLLESVGIYNWEIIEQSERLGG